MKASTDVTFQDFNEFWSYTKYLSGNQRNTLFLSLPPKEQNRLQTSYRQGGWEDLFMRNRIDNVIDGIKKEYNIDLLKIRARAISGKCTYIKLSDWKFIDEALSSYPSDHLSYILGGIKIEREGNMACLFFRK